MRDRLPEVLERVDGGALWSDLEAICTLGGRFAGTESEVLARDFLAGRLAQSCGVAPVAHAVEYQGWTRGEAGLEIVGACGRALPCVPLVRSPATPPGGLEAEVVDLGRGEARDFERRAAAIPGRIVLVRHEYMFAAGTVHRRQKYAWAMQHGAAGFLIASHLEGELPVTGSSGAEAGRGISAAGVSAETARYLTGEDGSYPKIRLRIACETGPACTENLILDLPGRGPGRVVLAAHIDGHHLAQSAMDNASGLAVALAVAGALARSCERLERGLRIALFCIEEWALAGSRHYVEKLDEEERAAIDLVLNLDSVAGSPRLTALTSGFEALERFVLETAGAAGLALRAHRLLMANSDHYNFAIRGIPALRLVAGFDEPSSNLKYVLTPADTLDKIRPAEVEGAARLAATLALRACQAPELALRFSSTPAPGGTKGMSR
jgi:aminopeptidase YwaD